MSSTQLRLPPNGSPAETVLAQMQAAREHDVNWREGRAFSLVFRAGDDVTDLLQAAYTTFFAENGLNPTAFPSLRKFESEVVAMTAGLLGSDGSVRGNMTTGGTESILMAVLTAREWARANRPQIRRPEMVLPVSVHPAFDKAAHYFGVHAVHTPLREDFRAGVAAMRAAITPNTVLLVGSAPSYPQGVVDPIASIARLAQQHEILCHVDACVGGMMLPFVRRLGYPVPDFDFSVLGVTSLSVDLHKYGYAAKGASVILYRDKQLRRHQLYAAMDWPGGIYASPTMTGTRPGGAIAAAWAVMHYLGEAGYLRIADRVMRTTVRLRDGINSLKGLRVLSDPEMSVMAIAAEGYNVYDVGDEMSLRGWHLDRQQFPPCLHLTVNYAHAAVAEGFLQDLAEAVIQARKPGLHKLSSSLLPALARGAIKLLPEKAASRLTGAASGFLGGGDGLPQRSAAMYGMMGTLPNRDDLRELVLDLLEGFTESQE